MAALVLNHCIFLHAPKTGGTWAVEVLRRQDLPVASVLAPDGSTHPTVAQLRALGLSLPIISTVRHPVGWLQSFWRFFYARAWRQPAIPVPGFAPLLALSAPTFAQFAARYLDRCPGYVTELQRQYLDEADWICHQETLAVDLQDALVRYQQPYNPTSFTEEVHPRVNVSRPFPVACPDAVLASLRDVDTWVIDHFYASELADRHV